MDEQTQPNPDNYSDTTEMEQEVIDHVSKMLSVGVKPIVNPYKVELELDGKALDMDIDTGATVSLISERTYRTLFRHIPLTKPTLQLHTHTSAPIQVVLPRRRSRQS